MCYRAPAWEAVGREGTVGKQRPLHHSVFALAALWLGFAALAGCASRVWNRPLGAQSSTGRYDFRHRMPEQDDGTFVVLAFSGGGTRAAAFSYGVLEKLRATTVSVDGRPQSLLSRVNVITSVSGGSYTAAYYGLFGQRIFSDFAPRFLYRNWQGDLAALLLYPNHLLSIAARGYNRSDLVAAYLGRTLFRHRTFAEMSRHGLPFIILNASDLNNATTFSFIQPQFDFLCSDLSSYPVANAVMASAAVPPAFAPMALRNYKDCPQRHKAWVADALAHDAVLDRRYTVARALERYSDPARMPVLRLVDGGVTDNLGVRGSMMSPVAQEGDVPDMAGAFTAQQLRQVRHVLVVVANAQVYEAYPWSLQGRDPGIVDMTRASFNAALGLLNTETVSLAKRGFLMWQKHVNAMRPPDTPQVKVDFAVLTFNQISDRAERARFNAMPTTFHLQPAQVDALRALAGRLLEASPEFQAFRSALAADPGPVHPH
ncbi:MAG: patatin-like phospholipase family protein [Rhodanobacter sp.]|nr:MAG: patatin-like phospholipase family protein [Rhodanobacter sp.]